MNRYIRIYIHFLKTSTQLFMSHRFNFFVGALANILWTLSQLITLNYLFQKLPSFQGWKLADLILLLGFGQIFVYASATIFDLNLNKLKDKILSGAFDRLLTKPINIQFLASFEQFSVVTLIPMFTTVAPLIIYGLISRSYLSIENTIQAFVVGLGGIVTLYFLSLFISGFTFFIEDVRPIKEYIVIRTNDLARLPLSIFPKIIQSVLTFVVPIAFIAYYPVLIIRQEANFYQIIIFQLLITFMFWKLSQIVWQAGLKRYSGIS